MEPQGRHGPQYTGAVCLPEALNWICVGARVMNQRSPRVRELHDFDQYVLTLEGA